MWSVSAILSSRESKPLGFFLSVFHIFSTVYSNLCLHISIMNVHRRYRKAKESLRILIARCFPAYIIHALVSLKAAQHFLFHEWWVTVSRLDRDLVFVLVVLPDVCQQWRNLAKSSMAKYCLMWYQWKYLNVFNAQRHFYSLVMGQCLK